MNKLGRESWASGEIEVLANSLISVIWDPEQKTLSCHSWILNNTNFWPTSRPEDNEFVFLLSYWVCGNLLCSNRKFIQILYGFFFFCLFVFLGLHPQHMEVPRLEVKSELQLLAYATAIATQDTSCVCNLHHSSQQCQILNLQSEARDQTHILMATSQVH